MSFGQIWWNFSLSVNIEIGWGREQLTCWGSKFPSLKRDPKAWACNWCRKWDLIDQRLWHYYFTVVQLGMAFGVFSKEKQKQRILHFLSVSSSSSRAKSLLMNSALISSSIWRSDSVSLSLSRVYKPPIWELQRVGGKCEPFWGDYLVL